MRTVARFERGRCDLSGPALTLRMIWRFWSSRNFTRTWVTCPRDPVRPITFITIALQEQTNRTIVSKERAAKQTLEKHANGVLSSSSPCHGYTHAAAGAPSPPRACPTRRRHPRRATPPSIAFAGRVRAQRRVERTAKPKTANAGGETQRVSVH